MLIDFAVKNSGSFKEEAHWSFERSGSADNVVPSLTKASAGWDLTLSAVTAVLGANASGKTQLLDALKTAVTNVVQPEEDPLEASPFLLDKVSRREPTTFSLTFCLPGRIRDSDLNEYQYTYSIQGGRVMEERLSYVPLKGRRTERLLFERRTHERAPSNERGRFHQVGDEWYRWGVDLKGQKKVIAGLTAPTRLYLSEIAAAPASSVRNVLDWFASGIRFYPAVAFESEFDRVKDRLRQRSDDFRNKMSNYLVSADLGITGVRLARLSEDEVSAARRMWEEVSERFNGDLPFDIDQMVESQAWSVHMTHSGDSGDSYSIPLETESRGTQAMLSFASIVIDALESGATIVVDEIDASLHPLQVRHLIRQFADPQANPNQAQLIFTTHDATLLLNKPGLPRLLARDQIWLTEKDTHGESTLYSLADYSPRKEDDLFSRYLQGAYGGISRPRSTSLWDSL
jgi:AAA15 family ATPase/GTPase